MKYKLIIITILIFGAFLRLYNLDQMPSSPNWDEVSLGYNAYSISKTGQDEWGNSLPLIFRAYGDFKLPLYVYLSTPFIQLFGLNTFSIRLLSVISGILASFVFYLISRKLFTKSNIIPLLGLTIYALSPWSIFLSRIALEANLFLTLFLLSFYFLLQKKYWQSATFYGLCLFTYNSSRIILFPYIALLIYLIVKSNTLKKDWYKYSFFILSLLIFAFQSLDTSGQARYKWVTILDQGAINQINELRQDYPRIIVNKYTYFIYHATINYLKHFSPSYVFFQGGSHYQFNIPNFPLISTLLLPFFFLGFFSLCRKLLTKPTFPIFLILFFTLVAPLPSAITRDAPQILRSITFLPLVTLMILFGLNYLKNNLAIITYTSLAVIFTLFSFWNRYPIYAKNYALSWQYGHSQMTDYIQQNSHLYDQIIITKRYGEPHEFILFFSQYSPQKYHNDPNKKWAYYSDWYWVDGFDKYIFINDWEIKDFVPPSDKKILLITSPSNYDQTMFKSIYNISSPQGQSIFDITTNLK
jgi:4-amino-4-deoxy-L-arabinose transferase-like glycosyltransferase